MRPLKDDEGNLITREEIQPLQKTLESTIIITTCNWIRNTNGDGRTTGEHKPSDKNRSEFVNAIMLLKFGEAVRQDGIPPEALKTEAQTTANMLTPMLQEVRKEGRK
ncbi:unnamed protein product [Heterobilharzia americana]|nr:unnamed protein product [Heterobilharzia americana]